MTYPISSPCFCTSLRKSARALTAFYDSALDPSGLKVTQYALLNHLHRLGPVEFTTLSAAIRLERTTLVRNLDLLSKRGLVASGPNQGKSKAHLLRLTEEGTRVLEAARPMWAEAQEKIQGLFTRDEQALLDDFLRRLQGVARN